MDVRVKIEFQKSFNDLETVEEIRKYVYDNLKDIKELGIYDDEIKIKDVWDKNKRWQ